ncbi:MAG TPA: secondary thiamine-phosphate synthase enzyme YjbQ [Vicinamibacterales bacterium]|nr:secondary thiamine-phosphate synthase enzyme YjbQ [Vicinamibacterales bacterium]
MSRSSASTVRSTPISDVAASASGLRIHSETVAVETRERIELTDLTERVMSIVRRAGVREGIVHVWAMHTTCAVFVNEFQRALLSDMKQYIAGLVAHDAEWLHNDPQHSDCDRKNADAHLRALLLGHSLTLQVTAGEVVLGQWQRVLMAELDGPRARTLRVQVMGLA